MVGLTNKKIRWIIRRKAEGKKTNEQVAAAMKITPRRVQQLHQKYLASREIKHIPSKRNNPQTNGKFERWIEEYKKHRDKFESDLEFRDWYNAWSPQAWHFC